MKKALRILAVCAMLAVMVSSFSMSAFAARGINYIPDFEADHSFDYADILVVELRGNGTRDLTALLSDNVNASDITWSTSDSDVATVNANGILKGNQMGRCTVTALYPDASGQTLVVRFYVSIVGNLQLDYGVIKLEVGESVNLFDYYTPNLETKSVSISTSRIACSTNKDTGVVTGRELGTNTVTVSIVREDGFELVYPVIVQVIEK